MLTRRLVGEGPHLPQNCLCLRRCGAWCPRPDPDMTNQPLTVFNRGPRKKLWGLTKARVGESLHRPQPSPWDPMISHTSNVALTVQPYCANPWYQICCLGPHCTHPCLTLGGPGGLHLCQFFFTPGCCPMASQCLDTSAHTPSPLPQHEGQDWHSRYGAVCSLGLESLHLNRVLS